MLNRQLCGGALTRVDEVGYGAFWIKLEFVAPESWLGDTRKIKDGRAVSLFPFRASLFDIRAQRLGARRNHMSRPPHEESGGFDDIPSPGLETCAIVPVTD
jgi:hypothetical protein